MRLFDSVAIICDQSMYDVALALRAVLDSFALQPFLYRCVQKRQVLELLGGRIAPSDYIVLACHGVPDEHRVFFSVVDTVAGQEDVWERVEFSLTPANIPDLVRLPDRTIVSLACGSGQDAVAQAFLASGCRAFCGPTAAPETDAALMYTCAFFYHLLAAEHDPRCRVTEPDAAACAAAFDRAAQTGTGMFRYCTAIEDLAPHPLQAAGTRRRRPRQD
jgi:hypothetical protein